MTEDEYVKGVENLIIPGDKEITDVINSSIDLKF